MATVLIKSMTGVALDGLMTHMMCCHLKVQLHALRPSGLLGSIAMSSFLPSNAMIVICSESLVPHDPCLLCKGVHPLEQRCWAYTGPLLGEMALKKGCSASAKAHNI